MEETRAQKIFTTLYTDVNGFDISNKAAGRQTMDNRALTYGEVTFEGFGELLRDLGPRARGIFYDLGSGTGKAVILAALLGQFSVLVGIEILPELCAAAQQVRGRYRGETDRMVAPLESNPNIFFIPRDLLNYDWSDGDVIFCQTTCFPPPLMRALEEQLNKLRPGAIILNLTNPLRAPWFWLKYKKDYPFSWGPATVYCYEKL